MGLGKSNADSEDHETKRHDSWKSDVPSTTTNSAQLVVKIAGSCGLVACLLLFWHFAFAQPNPVAVATATYVTQPPTQPVTPVPVTPLATTTPVTPLATPVAQPSLPKPVANWKGWPKDAPPRAIAPFNAEQAKQHQEAWAKHFGVPVEYTNSIGMKFRLIPPGEYLRGSTKAEIDALIGTKALPDLQSEMPQHKVIVTEAIYLGIHEVTQKQYLTMMGINPSFFTRTGGGKGAIGDADTSDLPVDTVSWLDAGQFCTKLSEREKLAPFDLNHRGPTLPTGNGYRLPTEAQWEFACRAGTQTRYWTGDSKTDVRRAGVFTSRCTRPVGSLAANAFGLFDVHGNVWEWCLDGWNPEAYQPFRNEVAVDPLTLWNQVPNRALRGAHFYYGPENGRSAGREKAAQAFRYLDNGFRVAVSVAAVKAALANPPQIENANARQKEAEGDKHREQQEYAQAIACYREVIQHEPNNAAMLNRLAWVMAVSPQKDQPFDDALNFAQRANQEQPNNGFYRNTLGAVQFRSGQFAEALGNLVVVADAPPKNFGWLSHNLFFQALCHEKRGDRPNAQAAYGKALELLKNASGDTHRWKEARLLQKEVASLIVEK